MKRVLLTGMSGTVKSTVIEELAAHGYGALDTDYGGLSGLVSVPGDEPTGLDPGEDWLWREDCIQTLLSADDVDVLFLVGTSPNQGEFYPLFDHVVLPTAPAEVIVGRLATRTNNPYGKRLEEVSRVLSLLQTVEPMLRRGAGHVIDTSIPWTTWWQKCSGSWAYRLRRPPLENRETDGAAPGAHRYPLARLQPASQGSASSSIAPSEAGLCSPPNREL